MQQSGTVACAELGSRRRLLLLFVNPRSASSRVGLGCSGTKSLTSALRPIPASCHKQEPDARYSSAFQLCAVEGSRGIAEL